MPGSRPMASLASVPSLLARKGGARPAVYPLDGLTGLAVDDLGIADTGWNDFGLCDRRASLMLRLDARRREELRMASLHLGRSAQRILTEALDKFLSETPEATASAITRRQ